MVTERLGRNGDREVRVSSQPGAMRPRSQRSLRRVEMRSSDPRRSVAQPSLPFAPQKRAIFQPQLSKITNQFATLDSSTAVSTLRLPDARWSSLVARRAQKADSAFLRT